MTDYSRLPAHMQGTAMRYVEQGIPGGSFFHAVVTNDLIAAYAKGDDTNIAAMRDWVMWLYNDAPCGCSGSCGAVNSWVKAGGTSGIAKETEVKP